MKQIPKILCPHLFSLSLLPCCTRCSPLFHSQWRFRPIHWWQICFRQFGLTFTSLLMTLSFFKGVLPSLKHSQTFSKRQANCAIAWPFKNQYFFIVNSLSKHLDLWSWQFHRKLCTIEIVNFGIKSFLKSFLNRNSD